MNIIMELMDVQQTAEFLQLSPRTVERLTGRGELPGFRKVGRSARWAQSILQAWILAGCPSDAEEFEWTFRQEATGSAIRESDVASDMTTSTMPVTTRISTR